MHSVLENTLAPRIKVLDPDVASKIAAGEVVERPASVLKELLENSLDAGASKIDVVVEEGGIQSITVIDNGCGIVQQDLYLALQQHATSKIDTEADLAHITSLGFRGEALASINSISRLSITAHTAQQDHAWSIKSAQLSPAAHPIGTTIQVQDLFYNVPARRKFLRSSRTEYIYLEEVFRRIALSHFKVAFTLKHNGKLLKNLPACNDKTGMQRRLSNICGKQLLQNALFIDAEQNGMRLWGWLGSVATARSQEPHQYFFINKRIIKDRLINHAIRQVYQPLCIQGTMPFYCLYLEVDQVALDVNVHPTKHEVRFRDARVIHAFLTQTLGNALMQVHTQPTTTQVPQIKFSEYNYPSAHVPNDITLLPENQVLALVEQKILLACQNKQLIIVDTLQAQKALLLQELILHRAHHTVLAMPIVVSSSLEISPAFALWCKDYGIDLTTIGPGKLAIRSLPEPLSTQTIDFVELVTKLHAMWAKNTTVVECLNVLVEATKFTAITQLEAQSLLQQALKLPKGNIYRIMTADDLQLLLA